MIAAFRLERYTARHLKNEDSMGITLRALRLVGSPSSLVDVSLDENRIVAIHPSSSSEAADWSGRQVAFSGFINAHTHLPMVLLRGLADDVPLQTWLEEHVWPAERNLTPEDVYWGSLLAIAEGIRSGTTTFFDMYFNCDEIARAVEESGVRAMLSYGMVAPSLDDRGREELKRSIDLVKRWNHRANDRIHVALSPHALYTCGHDVWRETIEQAQCLGVPIHSHVAETRSEVQEWIARTGMTPVRSLEELGAFAVPMVAAHCVHVSDEDIASLSEGNVTVAHCPKSNAKLGSGIAPVAKMLQAGVRVAIGTDGAASNNRLDMLDEMRSAWVLQRGRAENPSLLPSRDVIS